MGIEAPLAGCTAVTKAALLIVQQAAPLWSAKASTDRSSMTLVAALAVMAMFAKNGSNGAGAAADAGGSCDCCDIS